jgi:hypothetical protein
MKVAQLFESDLGYQVLGIFEEWLGVRHTLEPSQERYIRTGEYAPIDPVEMAIRKGRRDAFYLIENAVLRGRALIKEKGV